MALSKILTDEIDSYIENISKKYKILGEKPYSIDTNFICREIKDNLKQVTIQEFEDKLGLEIGKSDDNNIHFIDNYEKLYLNFDIHEIVIPDDMLKFYSKYDGCILTHKNLTKYVSYNLSLLQPKFCKLHELFCATEIFRIADFEFDPRIAEEDGQVNALDYLVFCEDPHSLDNGNGFFCTCLNPESINYRKIYSFSSTDDGNFVEIASTFTEFLYILSENADRLLSGKWDDDFKEKRYKYALSICDFTCLNCD